MHESMDRLGRKVLEFYEVPGAEAPYLLYVYAPDQEYPVRRDLGALRLWLQAKGVRCVAISLADLFWQALEESGWLGPLIDEERRAEGDAAALAAVHRSIGEVLREPPTLPDRVVAALAETDARAAVFLYRAGSLYPAYRTSTLLDDLRARIDRPVTLLYPGHVVGEFGLAFMSRCEPAYGYRATIVPRGADR